MKKSVILTSITSLFLINFVSAYNSGSLGDLLNQLDPSTVILSLLFLGSLVLINLALSRVLKGQKGVAGLLSFIVSFWIIYTINASGFDYHGTYYGIFDSIGLSSDIASTILPILIFLIALIIIIKSGFGLLLIVIGGFIFGYGILFAYEKALTAAIGGIMTIVGIVLYKKKQDMVNGIPSSSSTFTKVFLPLIVLIALAAGIYAGGEILLLAGGIIIFILIIMFLRGRGSNAVGPAFSKGAGKIGAGGKAVGRGFLGAGKGIGKGIGAGTGWAKNKWQQKQQPKLWAKQARDAKDKQRELMKTSNLIDVAIAEAKRPEEIENILKHYKNDEAFTDKLKQAAMQKYERLKQAEQDAEIDDLVKQINLQGTQLRNSFVAAISDGQVDIEDLYRQLLSQIDRLGSRYPAHPRIKKALMEIQNLIKGIYKKARRR